jgi:DNA polymerase-1
MMHIATNLQELAKAFEAIYEPVMGLDLETKGLNFGQDAPVVAIGMASSKGSICVPVRHKDCIETPSLRKAINAALTGSQFVMHNSNFDLTMLRMHGLELPEKHHDTAVLSWLLDENDSNSLKATAEKYLDVERKDEKIKAWVERKKGKVQKELSFNVFYKNHTWNDVELEDLAAYVTQDALLTYDLYHQLHPMVEQEGLLVPYNNELAITKVLVKMQSRGIEIDTRGLGGLGKELSNRIEDTRKKIFSIAGSPLDLASNQQLAKLLFNDLGLPCEATTATGLPKVDKAVLQSLADRDVEVAELLLSFRKDMKVLSTYVIGLMENSYQGRIHCSFNQIGTVTGRFSSSRPNLQNIPAGDFRKNFVAAYNKSLIKLDYSQIELRLLAVMSKDEELIKAFESGTDIHTATAELLGIERRQAKTINFGIVYGISAFGLGPMLDMSDLEAEALINKWRTTFWQADKWAREVQKKAMNEGYVLTWSGRKRRLEGWDSNDVRIRNRIRRQAVNSVVQGSAADLMKMAMLKVDSYISGIDTADILLTVHDELVIECLSGMDEVLGEQVKTIMENAIPQLGLPTPVDVQIADTWTEDEDDGEEQAEEVVLGGTENKVPQKKESRQEQTVPEEAGATETPIDTALRVEGNNIYVE